MAKRTTKPAKQQSAVSETGELTLQKENFCREFIVDLNGTKAAERAGYSKHTADSQASRLLTDVKVQQYIQQLMRERSARTAITADYVLSVIKETIDRCRQAVPVEVWDPESKSMVKTGEWKFEHAGVLKGGELLARHLKLLTDKVEVSGTVALADRLARARKRTGD